MARGATRTKIGPVMNTPIEVDTKLAESHGRYAALRSKQLSYLKRAEQVRHRDPKYADQLVDMAKDCDDEVEETVAEMAPLEAQYATQRWTRAFVVPGGHVHSSMNCSTCYPTTEFGWVVEMSDSTQAEIIEAAGSRACTVCYPNAPVDAPAGRIFHATELEAEQARQKRAAKKAAADDKKVANAIGPHRTSDRELISTVHQAKAYLTDGFEWGWNHPSYSQEDRDAIAVLLAAKLGTTPENELEAATKRSKNRS